MRTLASDVIPATLQAMLLWGGKEIFDPSQYMIGTVQSLATSIVVLDAMIPRVQ